MRSPQNLDKGFTLIEVLISISILASIGTLGFFMSIDQYKTYALDSDMTTVASLLQRARSLSMNNINSSDHGFYFTQGDYIIFQGSSYAARNTNFDEITKASQLVTFSGSTEIVFKRLRGDIAVGSGQVILSNGSSTRTITLNNEGQISW